MTQQEVAKVRGHYLLLTFQHELDVQGQLACRSKQSLHCLHAMTRQLKDPVVGRGLTSLLQPVSRFLLGAYQAEQWPLTAGQLVAHSAFPERIKGV